MALADSFSNGLEVLGSQQAGRLVRRCQQPFPQFRSDLEWLLMRLTDRPENLVDQFAGVGADAGPHLLQEKLLNIFGQGNRHIETLPSSGGPVKPANSVPVDPSRR